MTLKQLKYLLGVVDNGFNITTAAERLYTSQPGISKQLRQLEQEIGVRVFSRKGKALVGLSPAGKQIADIARRVLRDVDNIRSLGEELTAETDGKLSIATTHTQARYVLPDILRQFHARYPNVQLELHQGTSEQIAALVAENRVDFAIATESQGLFPELNLLPCYRWDRLVLTPTGHPLALDEDELTLEALAEHPLVTYVFSSSRDSSFLTAFRDRNLEPSVVFTARDADVIKTYVRMGMGVGVVAPMAYLPDDVGELHAVCARNLFPTVTTWLGFPRDKVLRGYMKDFIGLVAPHWPTHLVDEAIVADTQEQVDAIAETLDVPTVGGCGETLQTAA